MNILRLSTLSLTVAIAVFALGYNPSFAGKPDSDGNHDHGDGQDKTETVFQVQMVQGGLNENTPGLVTTDPACGSTEGELHLGVVFPDDCWFTNEASYISGPTGSPGILRLWYVQVNLNKSNVKIWFLPDDHNNVFVTDHLAVTIIGGPPSAFTVVVTEGDNLAVKMNHNPGKGDLVGPIAIGNIVYTPKPPPP